ncbi:MAG TPA: hypothetical protein VHF89_18030, partial [Solirubrobacteraceae bacterium]|nr:hypothetical protein [Solirubrobacteraceae bacterium]
DDAISVAAVYLGPPVQMSVVTAAGVREVPQAEIRGGLSDSVDEWKARQRETLGPLAPPAAVVRDAAAPTAAARAPAAEAAATVTPLPAAEAGTAATPLPAAEAGAAATPLPAADAARAGPSLRRRL